MATTMTKEDRTLAAEQQRLAAIYQKLGHIEAQIKSAKDEIESATARLAEAAQRGADDEVAQLAERIADLQRRLPILEAEEVGLRRAAAAQAEAVERAREPVHRAQVAQALREWAELLDRLEAWIERGAPLIGPLASGSGLGGFGARLIDAATARPLAVGPGQGDVQTWRQNTDALLEKARAAGYKV